MRELQDINERVPKGYFWKGQLQHLMFLLVMIPGALYLAEPALGDSQWLGLSDRHWVWSTIAVVVTHQIIAWLVFRVQMCFSLFGRLFGKADLTVWGIIFFPFLFARPLLTIAVGISDYGSLSVARPWQIGLGCLLLPPAMYTMYSVKRYFGFTRAIGADHFRDSYRKLPLVREGAFKYSDNAMYSFAFLMNWAIALLCGSKAALAIALFQHTYIWVHMYCTEQSDLDILYGNNDTETANETK